MSEAAVTPHPAAVRNPMMSAGDVWGGLAAMLVAFPSAIAFGVVIFTAASPTLAGEGALAGIVGAAALGIIAPLIGRNRGFITAPCAPAAAVLSGLAAELAQNGQTPVARILSILALTALLSAFLQLGYGALGVGKLIKFIPFQVVSGYMSGVAVIIAVAQIPKLLGVPGKTHIMEALISPHLWRWQGIVVGLVTMATMAIAPKLTKAVPGAIIGLACGISSYFLLGMVRPEMLQLENNPLIIGPIKASGSFAEVVSSRLGAFRAITPGDIALIIGPALTLSVLLSIDTLKTGVVLDALIRSRHNSNRELFAQGVANLGSFFSGGVAGSGTMGASLVNVSSGGRSMWSGVIEGSLVLLGFLAFGKMMAWVPIGALAGILLVIAFRMFDFKMFKLLVTKGSRLDFVIIATVVVVSEAVGLIQAAIVGVMLAIILFIRGEIRSSVIVRKCDLRQMRSARRRSREENALLDEHGNAGLFVQLRGELFFGTTDQLYNELEKDLSEKRFILFDLRRVESVDYTAAHLLTQMQERLGERGGQLLFSGMPSTGPTGYDIQKYMSELGVLAGAGKVSVFETRDSAVEWMEERILESAGWQSVESMAPLEPHEIPLMELVDESSLADLREALQARSFKPGEKIFAIGDAGDEIFLVRSGRVHILLPLPGGKRHHLATMCRGDFFGEMSFLDHRDRSAEAEAATDVDLFIMSRTAFDRIAEKNFHLASNIYEQLARAIALRLRTTDGELRALEVR